MIISEKIRTALWLLTKRSGFAKRFMIYLAFKRENRDWLCSPDWSIRIRQATACPDNRFIPRVASAGTIIDGQLVMHNGLRVYELSYDGEGPRDLMRANQGVHEPQEERLFMEVLKYLPVGSTMLELGSYWAFYSMWFYKEIAGAYCFCVEPETRNIQMGKDNFALNFGDSPPGVIFEQAYAGQNDKTADSKTVIPTISVDGFLSKRGISTLALLHADTQGHELDVLKGAATSLSAKAIKFLFISTHTNQLHRACLEELHRHNYHILADIDLLETFSFDGLIVAQSPETPEIPSCHLSLRGY